MKKKLFQFFPLGLFLYLLILSFFDYFIPPELIILAGLLILGHFFHYVISKHMSLYVLKRIFGSLLTLFFVTTVTFFILRTLPGGPFDDTKALPPEVKKNIEAKYKLDAPLYKQYFFYMSNLIRGDLGESYKYVDRPILDIIQSSLPASFQLGIYSFLLALLIGIPLGLFAATCYNTNKDRLFMILAISGISLPNFLLASCLIALFSFHLKWFPAAFWNGPEYYVLPMIALGVRFSAIIARLTRISALDVIHSDYIRTAYAKGLSHRKVIYKHVLKNSLLPVLTACGPIFAGVLTGSFVIEVIFAIPGMGKHFVQSVTNRDYPLILSVTLLYSFLLIFANLIVDLLYSYLDPRLQLDESTA